METCSSHRLIGPAEPAFPVVLSVPHAGRCWTAEMSAATTHGTDELRSLEDRYADRLVETAAQAGFTALIADVPRAWIDLNRAPDDLDWPRLLNEPAQPVSGRAAAGIGVVPDRLPGIGTIWRSPPDRHEVSRRVAEFHAPWHQTVRSLLLSVAERFGEALLLDVHSMPAVGPQRGSMVLGTLNGQGVSGEWVAVARTTLLSRRRRVTIDRPYAGAHIAERHGAPANRRHVLQLELCRSLYLDGFGDRVSGGLTRCQEDVLGVAQALSGAIVNSTLPLAAE